MSERIAERLSADQLLAVVAHEAAHVLLRHGPRKVAWAVGVLITWIAASISAGLVIDRLLPAWAGFARFLFVCIPLGFARQFYELHVTRRHEAEADDFAIDVAGPDATLGALEAITDVRLHAALLHNRWTTHGTWERRTGRIRARKNADLIK
jgi:Zn-dependent protease with chaperone function